MREGSSVLLERSGAVATVRFNRPDRRNALDDDAVSAFEDALLAVREDADVRVVILTGAGRAFCAGFDLAGVDDSPGVQQLGETAAWSVQQERFAGLVDQMRSLRQPVIAAVNGAAAGAGFGLALAADVRVAGESARFNAAFVRVGLSGCDIGVSYLLPRCVGLSRSMDILLTGRDVGAREAAQIGLVSRSVPDENLLDEAHALADAISANSPFGVWMTKRGVLANLEISSFRAAIELENRTQVLARTTGEMSAAAHRFLGERSSSPRSDGAP